MNNLAYVVVLLFDRDSEEKILKFLHSIDENSADTYMMDNFGKPHITIGICDEINEEMVYTMLEAFAKSSEKFCLRFGSLGIFPYDKNTLFLSPVITDSLLKLHRDFYNYFTEECCKHPSGQYLPNKWVPHCSLAVDMTTEESINAIRCLIENFQPLDACIEYIGTAKYSSGLEKPIIRKFDIGK